MHHPLELLSTEYTLHSTPPASPVRAPAMAPAETDIQAELHYLRQRNEELQSQVNKLSHERDSSGENKTREGDGKKGGATPSTSGLHHRRVSRKGADLVDRIPSLPSPRPSPPTTPSRKNNNRVKSKLSDVDATKSNGHVDLHGALKGNPDPDGMARSGKEAVFDNEREGTNRLAKSQGLKRSADGAGSYMKALSIDAGDEEKGGRSPDVLPQKSPGGANDTDEDDDLIDDDSSHNKHIPRIVAGAPVSLTSGSANFPPFRDQLKERAGWLIGLLFLQSCSSFIIQYNEIFLQEHMVIVQFLTMLVGAGGNAGNQASVGVIRSLAVGTLNQHTMRPFLKREAKMALSMSLLIGLTGFIRAALFRTPPGETIAVTTSVFMIVLISVAIGSTLPLGMKKVGIDPAHSSTSIQVIMDILGVLITVCVSSFVLSFEVFQNDDTEGDGG